LPRLIVMRHGKSDWSAPGQRDFDRRLSARGRFAVPLVGAYLESQGLRPDRAIVSTACRTRETWQLVRGAFVQPPELQEEPRLYEASVETLLDVVRATPSQIGTLLLIGHNPGMAELVTTLAADAGFGGVNEKFPTAALAVLDIGGAWTVAAPGCATLERFITPQDLAPGKPV
jgi:phosphohistidine phosphatase